MRTSLILGALTSALLSGCVKEESSVFERQVQIMEAFQTSSSRSIDCDKFWGTGFVSEGLVCNVRDTSIAHESMLLLVFTFEGETGLPPIYAVRSVGAVEVYDLSDTVMPFLPNGTENIYAVYDTPEPEQSDILFNFGSAESDTVIAPAPGLADFINAALQAAAKH